MNRNFKYLTVGLCLLLTFFSLGTIFTVAQKTNSGSETPNKLNSKSVWEIVREKRQDAPFVILTPEDLAGFSKEQIENFFFAGNPCNSATAINYGQTVNGQLSNTDCQLPDNSYADFYSFNGTQGDQVTINLSSAAFDTYLGLANEIGNIHDRRR